MSGSGRPGTEELFFLGPRLRTSTRSPLFGEAALALHRVLLASVADARLLSTITSTDEDVYGGGR